MLNAIVPPNERVVVVVAAAGVLHFGGGHSLGIVCHSFSSGIFQPSLLPTV
jgi:hypothetical protein